MQRLPYNGAPRAHKLRHNVISSSLFNERWQGALRTRSYPGVFVVLASRWICPPSLPSSFSLSLSFSQCSPRGRAITAVLPRELVASRALRCRVSNVIHLLIETERSLSISRISRIRDIISSARTRYIARCQSSFLHYSRIRDTHHCRDCRICIFAITRAVVSLSRGACYTAVPRISVPSDCRVDVRFHARYVHHRRRGIAHTSSRACGNSLLPESRFSPDGQICRAQLFKSPCNLIFGSVQPNYIPRAIRSYDSSSLVRLDRTPVRNPRRRFVHRPNDSR